MLRLLLISLILSLCTTALHADPFGEIRDRIAGGPTGERHPNDNVEGVIWEYKGELEKGELEGKKEARIGGMFRMEGEALFAVGSVIRLPGKKDIEELIEAIKQGRPKTLKLPNFKPRRIGEFKLGRTGRLTLNFDDESEDPDALYGTMVLRPKKGQTTVYLGDFREKQGKKTIRSWQMTVRKVQD